MEANMVTTANILAVLAFAATALWIATLYRLIIRDEVISGCKEEIRRTEYKSGKLDAENDRLLAEVRQLQLALATQALTAENNRCAASYWQDEAMRQRAVIENAASRRIADILRRTYMVDLN